MRLPYCIYIFPVSTLFFKKNVFKTLVAYHLFHWLDTVSIVQFLQHTLRAFICRHFNAAPPPIPSYPSPEPLDNGGAVNFNVRSWAQLQHQQVQH